MRWIVTKDHHGGCIGLGKDANGVDTRGTPEQGDALPMEFRLYEASGNLLSRDVVATLTRIGGTALSR